MASPSSRPELRPIETIVVPDKRHGKVLVLRDTQGITDGQAVIPPHLAPIVLRFTGELTCTEIAAEAAADIGFEVPVDVVVRLAEQLEEGLFLEGATSRRARARVEKDFADARVRPASHAGGAYHADPAKLRQYLDEKCIARVKPNGHGTKGPLRALVAPHIDPWRGALGYGHAYRALAAALHEEVDTFVLFGTSHAPMREPFALCKKAFATPLGDLPPDDQAIDSIAAELPFDPFADQFNHKQEHSLEFQAVFLKHFLKEREARIIPILAGLGEQQARGTDPARDDRATRFLDAVSEAIARRPRQTVVVVGADLAHVGPRFGDALPLGPEERATLEATDRSSLARAAAADAPAFWADVMKDLRTRRVCGLAPMYALLRTLPAFGAVGHGEVLHYEQNVDPEEGSIVSHAAVAYFGPR